MAARSNDEIFEALGGLKASLDTVQRELAHAREERGKMYIKMDEQGQRIGHVERDIAEIKPKVTDLASVFFRLKYKAGGVILTLGVIGAIIGGLATYFIAEIKAFLFRLAGSV